MQPFFQKVRPPLVESPNGRMWWHSMPLPDGGRTSGANQDKDLQFKMWGALKIPDVGGLAGKTVLDIGANDGFFSLAALQAGAASVTSLNIADWPTWPHNIEYASNAWGLSPKIRTGDFRTIDLAEPFDVIFFFGILYHLEDVFGCMRILRSMLKDEGRLYVESQMSGIACETPIFEAASDCFPTIERMKKDRLKGGGFSNFLFPNEAAMKNLAFSYDFGFESLNGAHNHYTAHHPSRHVYLFTKKNASSRGCPPEPAS